MPSCILDCKPLNGARRKEDQSNLFKQLNICNISTIFQCEIVILKKSLAFDMGSKIGHMTSKWSVSAPELYKKKYINYIMMQTQLQYYIYLNKVGLLRLYYLQRHRLLKKKNNIAALNVAT